MLIFNGCAMAGMPFVSDLWLLGVIARAGLTGTDIIVIDTISCAIFC